MNFEFTGLAGWVIGVVIITTTISLLLIGAFNLFSTIIIDVMLRKALQWINVHKTFIRFIYYYTDFKMYLKQRDNRKMPESKPMYDHE
ncbi:hypothetical protein VF04_35000 [Nostoc linckia z7]|uniref:Uncharacterized protein n=1 Tax=Nostoc linckia z7 TaxID=1628745 RepID=A0ABX4KEL4_NOSLI|nr:hypothetical protein VF05_32275 [Nostoc linckia z3]PHJ63666.1 hypothetical protein VF03_30150 [Nostoc linckia z2]PHJ73872.1 hypothetical protein VF06_35740 [Nostoc linckia z4]PHJ87187.1 hypothetical protein VF04_35000 [Nostoc linckia z7]